MSTIATAQLLASAKARAIASGKIVGYSDADRRSQLDVAVLKAKFFEILRSYEGNTRRKLAQIRKYLRHLESDEIDSVLYIIVEPMRSEALDLLNWMCDTLREVIDETKEVLRQERRAAAEENVDSIASRVIAWRTPSSRRSPVILGQFEGVSYTSMAELQQLIDDRNPEEGADMIVDTVGIRGSLPLVIARESTNEKF